MLNQVGYSMMLEKEAVNRYLMAKSHLLPDSRLDSAGAVLRDLVVLDANNLDDAYYSLYLRVKRFDVVSLEKGLYRGTSMARLKGLKNYVQIIPQEYLPVVYTVSKKGREAAAGNLLNTWGIAEDEYRKVGSKTLEALGEKEKTLVQLKKSLSAVSREIVKKRKEKAMNISVVAQAMQDRWLLLRGGIGRHPGENPGRFSIFKNRFKLKLDMDRNEALSILAKRYVKTYGPASAEDLAWWAGVTPGEASRALGSLDNVEAVEIQGVEGRFFIDKRDEGLMDETFHEPFVLFLPRDDPYVKAYYDDARFVPRGFEVMTKFGESKSVVLVDGAVWGTWAVRKETMGFTCEVRLLEGCPAEIEIIEHAAGETGRFYTGGAVDIDVREQALPGSR